ncbi:MAG: alpha-N-arabinofuranosidase [Clostridiales bacterium]|nr:alpha-N-arabinofuranosidase [Clostridiales bacterium]
MEKYLINPNQKLSKISKDVYGCFSEHLGRCIYEGTYVGEDSPIPNVNGMRTDVVTALKDMGLPVLRWPGGCFADEYHWKDGIGKKENRKKMVNTNWGGVVEDNSFGTHEFFDLCKQVGCESYVAGNVGSGTVQEMAEWKEYITSNADSPITQIRKENGQDEPWKLKYFGIGNENWGCGGLMSPEHYAEVYKNYAIYVAKHDGNKALKIACGPNGADYNWTEVMMKKAYPHMEGLSLHYYTHASGENRATVFDAKEYYDTLKNAYRMEDIVSRHIAIMERYDTINHTALIVDEWGTWYRVEEGTNPAFLYQQNTIRDALVAGLTLNIFNKHSDRIRMATIAQTINVLQSVALTDGEEMVLTPTYYVFKMYKDHHENTLLGSYITTKNIYEGAKLPQLIESASIKEDGTIVSTIVNTSMSENAEVHCQVADFKVKEITAEIVTGDAHDYNDFDKKDVVKIRGFENFKKTEDGFTATLPPCSVVKFIIK